MTRVAAVQMVSGTNVEENLAQAERLIAAAAGAGARRVALPENFSIMGRQDNERLAAAEIDGGGPTQQFLADQARHQRIWLVGGTIPLRTDAGKVTTSCLVYNDRGERVARYDKMHLFDVQLGNGEHYRESNVVMAGDQVTTLATPFGNIGLAICYDLRFPELFRRLLDAGAEIYVIPSAFTAHTGRAHWETLVRARAIENLAYVIAPGQGGRHPNGRETHGDSMVVGPWGEILNRRATGAGVVLAECDLAQLNTVRNQLPSIQHRKLT
jgi:deaminated glutathione amidase